MIKKKKKKNVKMYVCLVASILATLRSLLEVSFTRVVRVISCARTPVYIHCIPHFLVETTSLNFVRHMQTTILHCKLHSNVYEYDCSLFLGY